MPDIFSLSPRERVGVRGYLQAALLLILLSSCSSDLLAAPRPRPSPTPPPPIDFSGVWDLDEK
ncbi:MAG TPA: hypothetical protein VER78_07170, partial [Thermoanaerobaculia bacterium]|nr:hypothetical protein [Thermoanaerobaculia bacterium]